MASLSKRNYGIDFLRMLSMLMVVVLHVLGQGGIIGSTTVLSANYEVAWLFETAAYCAVNCFALISGYVCVEASFKYSRLIALWFQVVFYTVGITVLFNIFRPETITGLSYAKAFMPMMFREYWYFTSYFGMFFFIPIFNYILNSASQKILKVLIGSCVFVLSVVPVVSSIITTIAKTNGTDLFSTVGGYSMIWLSALYIIGGYIKKYNPMDKWKKSYYMLGYVISIFVTWLIKYLVETATSRSSGGLVYGNFFISYTSPTILLAGVFLLLFFSKCNFRSKAGCKAIAILSPAAFSVYIIHVHPLPWEYIMKGLTASFAKLDTFSMIFTFIGAVVSIYLLCSLIDLIRIYIFKLFKVNEFSEFLEKQFKRFYKWALSLFHIYLNV